MGTHGDKLHKGSCIIFYDIPTFSHSLCWFGKQESATLRKRQGMLQEITKKRSL